MDVAQDAQVVEEGAPLHAHVLVVLDVVHRVVRVMPHA